MMPNQLRAICFILLLIAGALYLYTGNQKEHYNATAPDEIAHMLQDIDSWQADALSSHLAQEAKKIITPEQLSNVLAFYRPLGRFDKIESLHFSRLASALSLLGKTYIGYSGHVLYQGGRAELTITLVKEDNRLKISNINMSSQALTQR
ncbi:MAG: hypothetical protein ACJA0N_000669 [Pseudohongiellaceae bacterium]|jgi:hypothetical protein